MSYFRNAVCPVCKQQLAEQDDVVVCPECGAPYHRACYKQSGHCLYEDKHGAGFSYLPDPPSGEQAEAAGFVICPHCGKGNPVDATACGNCGSPLPVRPQTGRPNPRHSEPPPDATPAYRRSRADATPDTGKFRPLGDGGIHFGPLDENGEPINPMEQLLSQLDENEKLDGFTFREWLSFLGPSGPVYLFQFRQMDTNRTGHSFSLSAALFAPIYFLYRKMWGWGLLALLGETLCALPALLGTLYTMHAITALPWSMTLQTLQQAALYVMYLGLALDLFWGFAAYKLYRRQCVRQIGAVKQDFDTNRQADTAPEVLYQMLAHKGGVNMAAGLVGVLTYLPSFFILLLP